MAERDAHGLEIVEALLEAVVNLELLHLGVQLGAVPVIVQLVPVTFTA